MRFHLLSDLHLEFSRASTFLPGDKDGILLLAGDICLPAMYRANRTDKEATKMRPKFEYFFREECSKYKKAYYIAGNHEYYHSRWKEAHDLLPTMVEGTNVTFLDKQWVEVDPGIWLFGGTLWTDFNKGDEKAKASWYMSMNDPRYLDLEQEVEDFNQTLKIILGGPRESKGKRIIMTHMAPSMHSSHPKFNKEKNSLNYSFCSNLDGFIEHLGADIWVHGHTHDSWDYQIGKTRVLCNPRGYPNMYGLYENPAFDPAFGFEI